MDASSVFSYSLSSHRMHMNQIFQVYVKYFKLSKIACVIIFKFKYICWRIVFSNYFHILAHSSENCRCTAQIAIFI